MPLERTIVAAIVRMAERHGWMAIKVHGGPMQKAGLPDLLCLKDGRAVWLEVKQPGLGKKSEPTLLQQRRMAELRTRGGCSVFVVTSAEDAESALVLGGVPSPRRCAVDPVASRCERRSVCTRCP